MIQVWKFYFCRHFEQFCQKKQKKRKFSKLKKALGLNEMQSCNISFWLMMCYVLVPIGFDIVVVEVVDSNISVIPLWGTLLPSD